MPASRYIFGTLPWYSVLILTGVIAALLLCMAEEKRRNLPKDTTIDLALTVVPLGIVGARLYYVIFSWQMFADDLLSILQVWNGGLAIYGGVIGGALGAWLYHRHKKLPMGVLADCIAPGLALAQSIGRWGNFFNMEAYGLAITESALQFFPLAVYIPSDGGWHMATFFYESLWDFGVFLFLWLNRKKHRRDGDGFLWYLLLYGGGRLLIEGLRTDSLMSFGGSFRVSQLLSLLLCAAACGVFVLRGFKAAPAGRKRLTLGLTTALVVLALLLLVAGLPLLQRELCGAGCAALCVIITLLWRGDDKPETEEVHADI